MEARNATMAAAAAAAAPPTSAAPAKSTPMSPPVSPSPSMSPNRNASHPNNNDNDKNNTWCHSDAVLKRTVTYVQQDFASIVAASPFLQTAQPHAEHIALFSRHEIITGHRIGTGGFSVVYEIVGFCLDDNITAQLSPSQAQLRFHYQQQVVSDMASAASTSSASSTTSSTASPLSSRFVLKHLQERLLVQPEAFACAASDLAVEAAFMSSLHHANICQVRGLPIQGLDAFSSVCSSNKNSNHNNNNNNSGCQCCMHDGYFIILDRLHDTLDQSIEREEREQQRHQQQQQSMLNNNSNHSNSMPNSTATTMNRLSRASLEQKTKQALQIAQALAYLHERRIVFRDLKPSNIGLDRDGNIQLFDFGLCRELPVSSVSPPSLPTSTSILTPCAAAACHKTNKSSVDSSSDANHDDDDDYYAFCCSSIDDPDHCYDGVDAYGSSSSCSQYCDEVFEMSGVGTRRYMAVEIINTRRYNCKADVYGWAMVVYEMLTLQKPFATYSMEDHQLFCCQNGERPSLHQRLLYKTSPSSSSIIHRTSTSHTISNNNSNANQLQQQQHDSSSSSSLAVRRMIAKVLEQSWCESVGNRLDSQQVCLAVTAILRTMEEMRNNNSSRDNSMRSLTSSLSNNDIAAATSAGQSAAAAAAGDKPTPDSPVGVNDIRLLLFPLALEYYYGGGYYFDSGGGGSGGSSADAVATADNDDNSSLLVTAADFRDDAPTTSMERQGQEILLLPKKSSSSKGGGGAAAGENTIPSHLFLPDMHQPLLLSHHHNEQQDDQYDHGNDDDDDDRDSDCNDHDDVQFATDTGRIVYRSPW